MNRVFYGVWGILALTTMVFDVIIISNKFTWVSFLGAVCQLILLMFIIAQYRKLDREAARRKRQARRSWRKDPNNWSV